MSLIIPSVDELKAQAQRLSAYIDSKHRFNLKPNSAQEALAAIYDVADWNTLRAMAVSPRKAGKPTHIVFGSEDGLPIEDSLLVGNILVNGLAGTGKSLLVEDILSQQTKRGGGWVYLSSRPPAFDLLRLQEMAKHSGRSDSIRVLDFTGIFNSDIWNPVAEGDPDEVASSLLRCIERSGTPHPGEEFYLQASNYALTVITAAVRASQGKSCSLHELCTLLLSPEKLEELLQSTNPDSQAHKDLSIFCNQYRRKDKDGSAKINQESLREAFGGIFGRLGLLASGKIGQIMNSANPTLDLTKAVAGNTMIFVSLPVMGASEVAGSIGGIFLSALRTALAARSKSNSRRGIPYFCVLDDDAMSLRRCPMAISIVEYFVVVENYQEKVGWKDLIKRCKY